MLKRLCLAAGPAAACLLSACATLPVAAGAALKSEAITAGAVAGEIAVRGRCPRNNIELGVLVTARSAFDLGAGIGLSAAQLDRINEAREETNRVCGIVRVDAPDPAPPPSV